MPQGYVHVKNSLIEMFGSNFFLNICAN